LLFFTIKPVECNHATTSQFENHLRAITGMPLGSTEAVGYSAMVNLIGEQPPQEILSKLPNAHIHLYGKSARVGRKLGHITICEQNRAHLLKNLHAIQKELGLPGA